MPYIAPELRPDIDKAVADLVRAIDGHGAGAANYAVTSLLCRAFGQRGIGYGQVNTMMGVLECVKQELYRRVAVSYETAKWAENGDVAAFHVGRCDGGGQHEPVDVQYRCGDQVVCRKCNKEEFTWAEEHKPDTEGSTDGSGHE
jgi:hypothetical protein